MIAMKTAVVTLADVPTAANFDVRTSSFFQHHSQLPSPEEVRSRARSQYLAGTHWGWKLRGVSTGYNAHPAPAVFEFKNISLFVKWGSDVRITEGQSLYAIRNSCGDSVPVPEIYGWRKDGDEMFLYMEAIHGKTLEEIWPTLNEDNRLCICNELQTILHNLRQLKQDPLDRFIGKSPCVVAFLHYTPTNTNIIIFLGSITRGNYYERALFLESQSEAGPFISVKDFHDWFIQQYKRKMSDPETVPEPYRKNLPDDKEIVFTHGDFHRSNIIISSTLPRVAALVDWEQSGWLPDYWEDCKAHWTAPYLGEWAVNYLPLILEQHESIRDAWDYYTNPVGS